MKKQLVCSVLIAAACGGDGSKHGSISGTISVGTTARVAPQPVVDDGREFVPGEVIVKFRSTSRRMIASRISTTATELELVRPMAGARTAIYRIADLAPLSLRDQRELTLRAVNALLAEPDVEDALPNYIWKTTAVPNDTHYKHQWHYPALKLPEAWELTKGAATTIVAVLDTGILYEQGVAARTHPDFVGRVVGGYDFITDPTAARDGNGRDPNAFDPGDNPGDSSFHGSHVAGTIGAKSNDGAGMAGVDWNAKILPIRVLGTGGGTLADIYEGLAWSAGLAVPGIPANPNPAKVINMSLGGPGACSPAVQSIVDQVLATGAIIVVAAGNDNVDAASFSPASCTGVITVGATDFAGKRAPYSNYGARIDVMAPGGDMGADLNSDGYADGVLSAAYDEASGQMNYKFENGTSMASPHVAGVVSLMKAVKPDLTAAQALQILKSTARPLTSAQCNSSGCGAGLVDAQAAVATAMKGTPTDPTDPVPPGAQPEGPFIVAALDKDGEVVEHSEHPAFTPDYAFAELDAGDYVLAGWIDVNKNNEIDRGDYFGASANVALDKGEELDIDFAIAPFTAARVDGDDRVVLGIRDSLR